MRRRVTGALVAGLSIAVATVGGSLAGAQRRGHDQSITEGIECGACHTPEGWRVSGSVSGDTGFDHARTGFPLSGRHRAVPCTGCHVPGQETTRECASCHEDFHQGRLGRACDRCHSAISWQRTQPIELHRLTRLPLTGMHVLAQCTDCHLSGNERVYSAAPAECYACHSTEYHRIDVHPTHDGSAGDPPFSRDCSLCHRANAWSPAVVDPTVLPRSSGLTAPSNHDIRFPVSFGPHRGASCESCHVSLDVPRAVACTGCHEHSPLRLRALHRGTTFTLDGGACLSCHAGGRGR
jgi:hypothetical protein